MSNDEKRNGPLETEVEALRAMLEQRRRDPEGRATDEEEMTDTSPDEEPEGSERENRDGNRAEPNAEENE